ncbi:hypothetical protein G210_0575 [Candida maltosa Xu316]|uniref:Nucleoporin Nup54 alpha-helical domain-containing protein n=1 Tax=Candida maltosa (strain Xu316) TaxID=1245528 RepID=M3HMW8_CANMX|nr:hypothetical protein G210_0575 [Candida maltosa Xu316]
MFGNNSSGGGLFGSSNTASSTGGGLFGSKPATTTGFGAQQPQQQSTNAFGGPSSTTTGGGLFGGANTNTNTNSGGLFGGNTNTGFGASNTGSTFGKPATTTTGGGLFGGAQQQQQSQQQPSTGGLFGGANTSNSTTGGGLFGSKPAGTTTGGGLFGGASNTATSNTGGLFGSKPAGTTGGLFGGAQQQQQQPSGGLFGGAQQNQQQPSGGLFGGAQQQQQPSGGLFGGAQQQPSSLFSTNTTNNAQPSFGWSQLPKTTTNTQATNAFNGQFGSNTNQQVNADPNTYTPAINDQLTKIWEQWDPNSPKCALKTYLYNKFSDQEINILLNQPRPANESPEDWDNAMMKRPGPNYYPVKVTSFNDVAQRIETQLDHVAKSRVLLNNINQNLDNLSSQHDLENTTRILKAKARHTKLSRRLLRLATVLAIIKLKGYPLLPEEEEISKQFDLLTSKLNDPNSSIGKLSDVFARLAILKERAEDLNYQFDHSINLLNNSLNETENSKDKISPTGNSEEVINKLSKILLKQQMGLNYLNDVLEKDIDSVKNIKK